MTIGIIIDLVLLVIIAGNAIYGYKRGLVAVVCGIATTILSIILVFILYRPVSNLILNKTNVDEKLESILGTKLSGMFQDENNNQIEITTNTKAYPIIKIFVGDKIGDFLQQTQESIIDSLSTQMSEKLIRIIIFLLLFVVIKLLLFVISDYLMLIGDLPFIRVINGSGGMIYGIIKGFVIIYVVFAILALVLPLIGDTTIISAIQKAPIGGKILDNNILLNWILK